MSVSRRELLAGSAVLVLSGCGSDQPKGQDPIVTTSTAGSAVADLPSAPERIPASFVTLGANGFDTLAAALASITDASPTKIYRILAQPNPDGYDAQNIVWKDDVELEGMGDEPVLLKCELPADTDPLEVGFTQPLHVAHRSRFINIRLRARNCRYPLSLGDDATPGLVTIDSCSLEHLGNDDVQAWQAAQGVIASDIGSRQMPGMLQPRRAYQRVS